MSAVSSRCWPSSGWPRRSRSLYVHVQLLSAAGLPQLLRRQRDGQLHPGVPEPVRVRWPACRSRCSGALWYVAVLLVLAGSRWGWPSLRENSPGYVFVLSTLGLGFVLYMAYASLVLLKTVCLMCVVTYVAVAGVVHHLRNEDVVPHDHDSPPPLQDAKAAVASPAALALMLVFVVGATTAVAFFPRAAAVAAARDGQAAGRRPPERVRALLGIPAAHAGARSRPTARPSLIVRFSDYQCPSCAQTYLDYKPILARYTAQYPGAIRVVAEGLPARDRVQLEPDPRHAPGLVRGRRGGRGWPTPRGAARRWRTGSTPTTRS